jgi:hypothetical protein
VTISDITVVWHQGEFSVSHGSGPDCVRVPNSPWLVFQKDVSHLLISRPQ